MGLMPLLVVNFKPVFIGGQQQFGIFSVICDNNLHGSWIEAILFYIYTTGQSFLCSTTGI